jgi:hypothetical protein
MLTFHCSHCHRDVTGCWAVLLAGRTKKTACSAHGSRRAVASKTRAAAAAPSGVQGAVAALLGLAAEAMSWRLQAAVQRGATVQACGAGTCRLATAAGAASRRQSMPFSQWMTMSERSHERWRGQHACVSGYACAASHTAWRGFVGAQRVLNGYCRACMGSVICCQQGQGARRV